MATQLFPATSFPPGMVVSPAVGPPLIPLGTSKISITATASDPTTNIDLAIEFSLDSGATWLAGPSVTGMVPFRRGVFIGTVGFSGDLLTGGRVVDTSTRVRMRLTNKAATAVNIGPGSVTLT